MQRAPMYRVIYDDLASQIRSGVLEPRAQLASEPELARQYGVSRMTVRQALDLLSADELVMRKQGSGTFVRENDRRGRRLTSLRSFSDELAKTSTQVRSDTIRADVVAAPAEVAEALSLDEGDQVNRLTRVRRVDGAAAALQDAWIPYRVAPGLVRGELVDGSLYRTLAERHGVELGWADQTMTATLLGEAEATLLEVEPGAPALRGLRITFGRTEGPVEFTYGWTLPEFPLLLRIENV